MAQQTALQFFLTKLIDLEIGKNYYIKQHQDLQDAYKEARRMEENIAFEMFKAGQDSMEEGGKSFEQYYNETYGGGESNVLGEVECYFIPSTNTSSGTICRNCGQEMFLHTFGEGIKVSTSPNPQNK